MSTFLVVLFALLVPALFILFIWFLIAPMSSSYKPWLLALAIIGLILWPLVTTVQAYWSPG